MTTRPEAHTPRAHERVACTLRERIHSGIWRSGQMLPGRHVLAAEQGVALTTVERAVTTLIAEGMLRADDRRGTFVMESMTSNPETRNGNTRTVGSRHEPVAATVGIVALVRPLQTAAARNAQWPVQILHACEHALSADPGLTQCFVNLRDADGQERDPEQVFQQLRAARVDGVIVIEHHAEALAARLSTLGAVPMVLALYDPIETPLPQVHIDSTPGGRAAARHLRQRGYRQLTFLRPFTAPWVEARLAGACAELGAANLRVFPADTSVHVAQVGTSHAPVGREALRQLLAAGFTRGMGIIAPNDSTAGGFMRAAAEQGLTAGVDYGIVGFDDGDREGQLTSLRPPLELLGAEAARLMLGRLRGENCPCRVALQHGLIARGSTAPWRQG